MRNTIGANYGAVEGGHVDRQFDIDAIAVVTRIGANGASVRFIEDSLRAIDPRRQLAQRRQNLIDRV